MAAASGSGSGGADGAAAGAQRWSLDLVSDTLTDGRRFQVLTVVDDYTRECLSLHADMSLSGLRLVRELDVLSLRRGQPVSCVSDNGTESHEHGDLALATRPGRRLAVL